MSVAGQVVEVQVNPRGSSLAADAAAGATSVTVLDPTPFDVAGSVQIDGTVYAYTALTLVDAAPDPDGNPGQQGVLTLTAGLAAASTETTPVWVWSGQVLSDVLLLVDTFTEGADPVPATPADDRANWTSYEGQVEPPIPGLLSDDLTEFTRDPGWAPTADVSTAVVDQDGTLLVDAIDAAAQSGGDSPPLVAPDSSPTPTVYAGSGVSVLTWEPLVDTRIRLALYIATATDSTTVDSSAPIDSTTLYSDDVTGAQFVSSVKPGGAVLDPTVTYQFALVAYVITTDGTRLSAPPSPWVLGTAGQVDPLLIADTAIIRALTTVDLSTTTLNSVNINGGSIAVAVTTNDSENQNFSGTSLPPGWASIKTGISGTATNPDPSPDVPGASVVSSGTPAGTNGSALLIDFGPGYDQAAGSRTAAGKVVTRFASATDADISTRFFATGTGRSDALYLAIRRQGLANDRATEDAIMLDLGMPDPYNQNRSTARMLSMVNGSIAELGNTGLTTGSTGVWMRARLRLVAGSVQAKVWNETLTEPEWSTVQQSGVLTPGEVAIVWRQDYFKPAFKVWFDYVNVTTYSTGFKVNPDGTGTVADLSAAVTANSGRVTALEQRSAVQARSTSSVSPTDTTNLTVPGASVTFSVASASEQWALEVNPDVSITNAGTTNYVEGLLDGSVVSALSVNTRGAATTRTTGYRRIYVTGLSAGTHTLTAQTRNSAASTGATVNANSTVAAIRTS